MSAGLASFLRTISGYVALLAVINKSAMFKKNISKLRRSSYSAHKTLFEAVKYFRTQNSLAPFIFNF